MFSSFYINSYLKNRTNSRDEKLSSETTKNTEVHTTEKRNDVTEFSHNSDTTTTTKHVSTNFLKNFISILSKNSQFDMQSDLSQTKDILMDEKKLI